MSAPTKKLSPTEITEVQHVLAEARAGRATLAQLNAASPSSDCKRRAEMEDLYLIAERLADIDEGRTRLIPLEEAMRDRNLL